MVWSPPKKMVLSLVIQEPRAIDDAPGQTAAVAALPCLEVGVRRPTRVLVRLEAVVRPPTPRPEVRQTVTVRANGRRPATPARPRPVEEAAVAVQTAGVAAEGLEEGVVPDVVAGPAPRVPTKVPTKGAPPTAPVTPVDIAPTVGQALAAGVVAQTPTKADARREVGVAVVVPTRPDARPGLVGLRLGPPFFPYS